MFDEFDIKKSVIEKMLRDLEEREGDDLKSRLKIGIKEPEITEFKSEDGMSGGKLVKGGGTIQVTKGTLNPEDDEIPDSIKRLMGIHEMNSLHDEDEDESEEDPTDILSRLKKIAKKG
ncbi:hypothetical protein [Leptospira bandrabouensis]|uniref:Uncharacterized protein n=1 Tax=Leptospira bandrabouensis TaxID=2484903 RepID=A0A6H3NKL0_9LEPT|nr:hypothetical protein [Leptospira bandrabouensis]TGN09981.1 hypothetical protein EHR07_00445 [Leptospira bandrabouensis]TGN12361.1 hypothetical protein EHR08_13345 [Leptospira bandrabouensis]